MKIKVGVEPEEDVARVRAVRAAAASIVWPSSLLVDRHVPRITKNVLEHFLG